jgi:hypothetical protein
MKRLLLATAAVIALAVATPLAMAQYTTPPPATAPYSTPLPDDPTTPQDEALAEQDTTANQPGPGTPEAAKPTDAVTPQPALAQEHTHTPESLQAQTTKPETEPTDVAAAEQASSTVADQSGMDTATTLASLEEHARDAGMDGLPMTAQEVCAPREIALTTSGASLSRDKEHQLINAADRASVCEFQRVVINSPNGRADEARQLLIDSGVDASLIEVQDSDASGLEVELNFAGVATSSEQYAQMFNPQQLASYQPSPSAPALPDEQNAPMGETDEDAMSPTSGNAAVKPGVLDT